MVLIAFIKLFLKKDVTIMIKQLLYYEIMIKSDNIVL
jgi:hypothetical protein